MFQVVGIINVFDVIPSLVEVIFKGEDGLLYRGIVDDNKAYFSEFVLLDKNLYEKVISLEKFLVTKEMVQPTYSVGDALLEGFLLDDNHLYIARIDRAINFLYDYLETITNNKLLKEEINGHILVLKPLVDNNDADFN